MIRLTDYDYATLNALSKYTLNTLMQEDHTPGQRSAFARRVNRLARAGYVRKDHTARLTQTGYRALDTQPTTNEPPVSIWKE